MPDDKHWSLDERVLSKHWDNRILPQLKVKSTSMSGSDDCHSLVLISHPEFPEVWSDDCAQRFPHPEIQCPTDDRRNLGSHLGTQR